ncbi:ankyrin repeat-containing domain protein [Mycotypha africana]|uniref:ankyrin repeat-containing domain protein n=1 Tax=Mycotypha africana TaxID=64632 RepID=UPI002301521D|nr:ankyrin repeat-containing domain protein [Mycotypha africana]KAI8975530.1 ankyrin repeat-containing domain protein [Mycotypha africana]
MTNHEEVLDDLIYYARAGELEELKNVENVTPEMFAEKNDTGKTALHMASANNHVDIVSYILEQFAKLDKEKKIDLVNVKNEQGNTPLHWAALNGHYDVVELLVNNGADCKIKNNMNISPIYEAQQRNHEKVAEFFLKTMVDEEEEEEPLGEDEQYVETGAPSTVTSSEKKDSEQVKKE